MTTDTMHVDSCPRCRSLQVYQVVYTNVRTETEGDTIYMLNSTHMACHACKYTWDHETSRGVDFKFC